GCQQRWDVQIAVLRRRRADADAFVRKAHMHGVSVRGRMHGDRSDAELLAGAQHTQRDLPAVGYQDFVEHREPSPSELSHSMIINGSPNSTGWPSSNRTCVTVP